MVNKIIKSVDIVQYTHILESYYELLYKYPIYGDQSFVKLLISGKSGTKCLCYTSNDDLARTVTPVVGSVDKSVDWNPDTYDQYGLSANENKTLVKWDLGSAKDVFIHFKTYAFGEGTVRSKLQTSLDDSTYDTLITAENTEVESYVKTNCRYIRIYGEHPSTGAGYVRVYDISIFEASQEATTVYDEISAEFDLIEVDLKNDRYVVYIDGIDVLYGCVSRVVEYNPLRAIYISIEEV